MAAPGGHVEVLVVDDHAPFRRAAYAVLAATPGFEAVGEAASGAEAVAVAAALRPDLILLDVTMPNLHGVEASRLLTEADPGAVVVLVSVDDDPVVRTAHQCCGAAAFLRKQDLCPRVLSELWEQHGRSAVPT